MIRHAGVLHHPDPQHVFWCASCDRQAQPRHVRERVVRSPPSSTLFHSAVTRTGAECGGQLHQRHRSQLHVPAGGTGGPAGADAAGHVLHGLAVASPRPAAPEAPQGPTPPATFPLTSQGQPGRVPSS